MDEGCFLSSTCADKGHLLLIRLPPHARHEKGNQPVKKPIFFPPIFDADFFPLNFLKNYYFPPNFETDFRANI
jgi:hypothetical protein